MRKITVIKINSIKAHLESLSSRRMKFYIYIIPIFPPAQSNASFQADKHDIPSMLLFSSYTDYFVGVGQSSGGVIFLTLGLQNRR